MYHFGGGGIGAAVTDTFEETYPVAAGARLDVQNQNGGITIVAVGGDSIVVRAVKHTNYGKSEFDKIQIEVTKGDPFTIVTKVLREPARVSVDYELSVPRSTLVRTAMTTNGSIEATGARGTMELRTSNGSLTLWVAQDLPATLEALTTNGNLDTDGITPDNATVSKHSIRGDLGVPKGTLSARTTNGNLTIHKLNP